VSHKNNFSYTPCPKNALLLRMNNSSYSASTHHATHFGFSPVQEDAKEAMVQAVFDRVATRYDLMNDAMSLGVHHHWKDRLMDTLRPTASMHVLDVAGGTGDVAFRFLARGGAHATVCDLNEEMLKVGQARAIDRNIDPSLLTWKHGNAEKLPFADATFDAYTISFGIRNVTHLDKALAEAYRVVKRGGRFLCLEFSTPPIAWLKKAYDAYSLHIIPKMGEALTGDAPSYHYLVESIRQFPDPESFATMIRNAGFDNVTYQRLSAGVVAIHSGWKL
jgi:demethylmenaquinone methyltransferase / 2-methoxy-6-polyprenyl-1,4-benzoquinol methylase